MDILSSAIGASVRGCWEGIGLLGGSTTRKKRTRNAVGRYHLGPFLREFRRWVLYPEAVSYSSSGRGIRIPNGGL